MLWWCTERDCVCVCFSVSLCIYVFCCSCLHECVSALLCKLWVLCSCFAACVFGVSQSCSVCCQSVLTSPFLFLFTDLVLHGCCPHVTALTCCSHCWLLFYPPSLFHVSQGQSRQCPLLPVSCISQLIHSDLTLSYCSQLLLAYRRVPA
jgi:hypothetical protein